MLTEQELKLRMLDAVDFVSDERSTLLKEHIVGCAAVLVPLTMINDTWHLLFIRRAEMEGDLHSGQVAFPGGRQEKIDLDLQHTALREAEEEVGLLTQEVSVIGHLQDEISIGGYSVTPIVGIVPWPYDFKLQKTEVSHIFTIPLDWLSDPKNSYSEFHHYPKLNKKLEVLYYNEYEGEKVWGLTARVTRKLLQALKI